MLLAEIIARQAEINKRFAEINARSKQEDVSTEELTALADEAEQLRNEQNGLLRQRARLLSETPNDNGAQPVIERSEPTAEEPEDIYNTLEYRKAFMDYVMRGQDNPILHKRDASTTGTTVTTDATAIIIPTLITDKLLETNPNAGSIYARVTKTAYPAGLTIPKELVKPKLRWVAENVNGTKDKAAVNGTIIFSGFKFEVKVGISFELQIRGLAGFEAAVVKKMQEALAEGFDEAIVVGSGSGSPTGIITGANYSTNAVKMNNKQIGDYAYWMQIYANIPLKKQSKVQLHINKTDWLSYVLGMKNNEGKVIALETMGFGGKPVYTFMGQEVVLMEDQGLKTFDTVTGNATASAQTAFAYFYVDEDYWFNLNSAPALKNYTDNDTDEKVQKIVGLADGKSTDDSSLIVICRDVDEVAVASK